MSSKRKIHLKIEITDWQGKTYLDEDLDINEITYSNIQRLLPKDVPF